MVACSLFMAACSSLPSPHLAGFPTEDVSSSDDNADDEDVAELIATLNRDLNRFDSREEEQTRFLASISTPRSAADPAPDDTLAFSAVTTTESTVGGSLLIPVIGVSASDLQDSFGASRDGGRRRHRGIDIFAPKGTDVVAVTAGRISYIGKQPKGGLCVWLESTDGTMSFFYAHLDKWAAGLREGMLVKQGQVLGVVGKTGNARRSAPHLHFVVVRDEKPINPFQVLRAESVEMAQNESEPSEITLASAGGGGQ